VVKRMNHKGTQRNTEEIIKASRCGQAWFLPG
jgi:hypothetical protein